MLRLGRLEPDVGYLDLPRVKAPRRDDQPHLEAMHRHGRIRPHGCARDLAARGVDTRREIDRDHRNARRVDPLDQRGRFRPRLAVKARPEQGVEDDVGTSVKLLGRFAPRLS